MRSGFFAAASPVDVLAGMADRGDVERCLSIALTWLRLRTVTIPPCRYQTPFLVSPASSALIDAPLVSRTITGADWLGANAFVAA